MCRTTSTWKSIYNFQNHFAAELFLQTGPVPINPNNSDNNSTHKICWSLMSKKPQRRSPRPGAALNLRQKEIKCSCYGVGAMYAIPSMPLSSHQSLKECAHVISLSCNLLGLQLKACIAGPHILALCLEPPAIRSKTDVMTDTIIKCTPQPKVNLVAHSTSILHPLYDIGS